MNDDQLLRYSRHILLPEIGVEGQEAILSAKVLVIGAGGLGSPVAMYLAAAGVGKLVIADNDTVDLTNLQRQIMHSTEMVGHPKVESARASLQRINPLANVVPLHTRLEDAALDEQVAAADLVLDCCDNFATRHAVNRACVKHRKPWFPGPPSASMGRCRCSTCAIRRRPAITACSPKARTSRRCAAP